jgi:hypothetical protein
VSTATERFTPGVRPHPGNPAWQEIRRGVLARDGWRCQSCGVTVKAVDSPADLAPDSACVDHIVPIVRGGWHDPVNLQALCLECNSLKGNHVIDYRRDVLLLAALDEQIEARGIDVDTPIRYRKRVSGRELRTEKLNIAVTPTEKKWLTEKFGGGRGVVDSLTELVG